MSAEPRENTISFLIDRSIDRLLARIRERADGVASVREERIAGTPIRIVSLTPDNPAAVPLWAVGEQWLVVGLGEGGARWELEHDDADQRFADEIVNAAVAGRVVETLGDEWSRLVVTFADGTEHVTEQREGRMTSPFRPFLRRRRLRAG